MYLNEVEVSLSEKEWKQYDILRQDMVLALNDTEIDAVNAAALSGKLLLMANGAVYNEDTNAIHIHDRKLDALEDLIEGANGKPLLIAICTTNEDKNKSRLSELTPLIERNAEQRKNISELLSKGYLDSSVFIKTNNDLLMEYSRL